MKPHINWSQPPVESSPDLRRILDLPRRSPPEIGPLVERVTALYARPRKGGCECKLVAPGKGCITCLWPVQAQALEEMAACNGLLAPIPVGGGKTGICLLAPLAIPDCKIALVLVPPKLLKQLGRDWRHFSQHFRVPNLIIHGENLRFESPTNEPQYLHAFPYSLLCRPEQTDFLGTTLCPDLIIADEADRLRHKNSAQSSRFLRYLLEHPETRLCVLTGSLTSKSLKDYAHLSAASLKEGAPTPLDPRVAEDWARVIRARKPDESEPPPGALMKLCLPGESVHSGFHRRFVETPGVVTAFEGDINIPMTITTADAPPIPDVVEGYLETLRDKWERPDEWEYDNALEKAACAEQLAHGFYYRWRYPRGEPSELIDRWLEARKAWMKAVRERLKRRFEFMDSVKHVTDAAIRAWDGCRPERGKPVWSPKPIAWPIWKALAGQVEPEPEAVWIDDYLAQAASDWAHSHTGIVWYGHRAFGKRVAELAGLPRFGGGPKAEERLRMETGTRSIIVSIRAFGRGFDGLQHYFHEQLITSPPADSTNWAQVLGRLARPGQEHEVLTQFFAHTPELAARYEQAVCRAQYVEETMGDKQKLLHFGLAGSL